MSCTVTETLNGEWELTLVHDIDERGKWARLSEGCILRAPVPAAMTPSVDLVTQQYQTSTYDVQIYKITTKSGPLHLRSGSGTNYRILGKYKKGREIIVLNKTTSSWYEVTAPDGKHGYMASQYLTFQRTETQTVQTNVGFRNQVIESRQLRDQPFRIYRVVPELDKVTVYPTLVFSILLRSPAAVRTDRSALCRSDEVKKLWAHFRRPPTAAQRSATHNMVLLHGAREAAAARVRARIRALLPPNPA